MSFLPFETNLLNGASKNSKAREMISSGVEILATAPCCWRRAWIFSILEGSVLGSWFCCNAAAKIFVGNAVTKDLHSSCIFDAKASLRIGWLESGVPKLTAILPSVLFAKYCCARINGQSSA